MKPLVALGLTSLARFLGLTETNALAYFSKVLITGRKSFTVEWIS
jgi:hypothetical protein